MANPLSGAEFYSDQMHNLTVPNGSPVLALVSETTTKSNAALLSGIPQYQQWRNAAHGIKAYELEHLDELLVQFESQLKSKGIEVLWAADREQANQIFLDLAKKHNVKKIVKSKSMVTEELALNHVLEKEGIKSVETDLGEFIIQLAKQRPTHIVIPALHLTAAQIGKLFSEKIGTKYTENNEELTMQAREYLRQEYLTADMGVSGVNFGVADTGSFVVIENEGNAGLSTSTPPVHVAIMGIEKLLPSIDYLPQFLNLLPRNGTGQKLTSYTHFFNGPSPGKKMYLILVDCGRTNVLTDPGSRAALGCMRCGHCMYACPVYRRVGGWAYGWVYPGPIGACLTGHFIGFDKAGKLPFVSSLCGACSTICPAKVPIPHILVHLRNKAVEEPSNMHSTRQTLLWSVWSWFNCRNWAYKPFMWGIRTGASLSFLIPRCFHVFEWRGWTTDGRKVPKPEGGSFKNWFKKQQ